MGHLLRMTDERVSEKAMKGQTEVKRPVGRPRGRCTDAVDREAKSVLKCKIWRKSAEDRDV